MHEIRSHLQVLISGLSQLNQRSNSFMEIQVRNGSLGNGRNFWNLKKKVERGKWMNPDQLRRRRKFVAVSVHPESVNPVRASKRDKSALRARPQTVRIYDFS
jgi:hypothetical protein